MSKYDTQLTNLVKDEIKRKGLVDSGKLLASIKVNSNVVNGTISIDIEAEDYFQYLDTKYRILSDVMNSKGWEDVIGQMSEEIVSEYIAESFNDIKPI